MHRTRAAGQCLVAMCPQRASYVLNLTEATGHRLQVGGRKGYRRQTTGRGEAAKETLAHNHFEIAPRFAFISSLKPQVSSLPPSLPPSPQSAPPPCPVACGLWPQAFLKPSPP